MMNVSSFKLTLCQTGCCPEVEVEGDHVTITDDWGGKVSLTTTELEILLAKYPTIQGES